MEVYDLIKIKEKIFDVELPKWAMETLEVSPYVVVRRGKSELIPVGIRGGEKRFGCYMSKDNCEKVITPEQIVEEKMWLNYPDTKWGEALEKVMEGLKDTIKWGPTGSVAFELVTGQKVTKEASDIDLIIKPRGDFSEMKARELLMKLDNTNLDIVLQTDIGWVALAEYVAGTGSYLIKTQTGETLVKR